MRVLQSWYKKLFPSSGDIFEKQGKKHLNNLMVRLKSFIHTKEVVGLWLLYDKEPPSSDILLYFSDIRVNFKDTFDINESDYFNVVGVETSDNSKYIFLECITLGYNRKLGYFHEVPDWPPFAYEKEDYCDLEDVPNFLEEYNASSFQPSLSSSKKDLED